MSLAHTFAVDLTNPGQYFACCGLLELATCLDAGAVGCFAADTFAMSVHPATVVRQLAKARASARQMGPAEFDGRYASASKPKTSTTFDPVTIGEPFTFEVDWWLKPRAATEFKTWSGDKQVPVTIINGLIAAVRDIADGEDDDTLMAGLFDRTSALAAQPFYFDGVGSRNPIDLGFHFGGDVRLRHHAFVELMTFVGLQRFHPRERESGGYRYACWNAPLPVSVASAVAAGLVPPLESQVFGFAVTNRDDYHKQFSQARRRSHVG